MSVVHPEDEALSLRERFVLNLYILSALAIFVLMMFLGLTMRTSQGNLVTVSPRLFYELMTAHGAGMVGTMGLASCASMWFFLRRYVTLRLSVFAANYLFFVVGAIAILSAVFIGGFAGAWTFLYPLPLHSVGLWNVNAAALFMVGYLLIGVGFLLFYLDAMLAIIRSYGNLGRGLGLPWLFGRDPGTAPAAAVVASTMVLIVNTLGILGGAVVLAVCLIGAYEPSLVLNALLAKNLIYFFGHVFINATIYMAVIAVYELLPRFSGRAWTVSRPFLWGWAATTVMVLIVYPHHLMMDYAMPTWMLVMGQIISFTSGLPVFVVTVYGALMNIHRSGINWTTPARLIVLSMFGWAAGIVPAIIDGTISVNKVMHNTQWVPGHFHFYLLLGALPMVLALMLHAMHAHGAVVEHTARIALPLYIVGGLVFVGGFLAAGHVSAPRRFAVHLPQWVVYDRIGSAGALLVIIAMLLFTGLIVRGVLRQGGRHPAANSGH